MGVRVMETQVLLIFHAASVPVPAGQLGLAVSQLKLGVSDPVLGVDVIHHKSLVDGSGLEEGSGAMVVEAQLFSSSMSPHPVDFAVAQLKVDERLPGLLVRVPLHPALEGRGKERGRGKNEKLQPSFTPAPTSNIRRAPAMLPSFSSM